MKEKPLCLVEEDKNPRNLNENPFKYLLPTLIHMTCVQVVISLFSQASLNYEAAFKLSSITSIAVVVREKISSLSIPKCLLPRLHFIVDLIESETRDAYLFTNRSSALIKPRIWGDINWASTGTLDYFKMVEEALESVNNYRISSEDKDQIVEMYSLFNEDEFDRFMLCMYDNAPFDDFFSSFWKCKTDDLRIDWLIQQIDLDQIQLRWDDQIHDTCLLTCFILSKLGKNITRRLIEEIGIELIMIFVSHLYYREYCLQILFLLDLYKVDLSYDYNHWCTVCKNISNSKTTYEYRVIMSIAQKMVDNFLYSTCFVDIVQMINEYFSVIRWEEPNQIELAKSVFFQLNEDEQKILYLRMTKWTNGPSNILLVCPVLIKQLFKNSL